ncbi:MAG TPA: hypothetical protein VKB47_14995 [Terracidiphilus sp.]|nr:hypothetical protein [Terracidiphilus sp.]
MTTSYLGISTRHEYRIKTWYRSFLLVLGAPALAGGITVLALASRSSSISLPTVMSLTFLGFGAYFVALALRSRVIIEGTRIEIRGAFTDREADLSEINGYRTISSRNGKYTQIYLNNGRRAVTLSNLFDHDDAFDAWFRKIPDLDKRDRDELLVKISQQEQLGATPEDRLAALSRAKTNSIFALVISLAASIAANWGVPALYLPFSLALALIPIVLAVMLHRAPLLYAVFKRKDDPRAELFFALTVTSFGLMIRARSIHFVSIESIGIVVAFLSVVYLGAFYHSYFESSSPARTFFLLLLLAGLYSYGVVTVADAVTDPSTPAHFVAHVVSKHYTTGRSRSFYLVLEPWGPLEQPSNLGVSQTQYDRTEPGDQVCLDLYPGRLNAAWYTQVSCSASPLDSQQ